jgi:DNA-binding transcriptional MocR family regulator
VASNVTETTSRQDLTDATNVGASLTSRFARRNDIYGPSIWTEILNHFKRHPDPVYFGDGSPDRNLIPLQRLKEASAKAWEEAPGCLGYGEQQGYEPLRQLIVERMRPLGIEGSADRVLVTSGSTQGLDLACRVFLEPGDVVLLENPTFLGATEIFRACEARLVPIETDGDGMRMDALEAALVAEPRAKMIYTIPTFQNPTGSTMPLERRQRLVDLARQYNVAVLEDDPYSELRYDGEVVAPLVSLDPNVIYLGTFSKTIAPGIRCGWTLAPAEVHRLLVANREVSDISNDRITMRTVYHAAEAFLTGHVAGTLDVYRSRRDTMLGALEEYLPDTVTWSRPQGGFFVWITLPEHIDTTALADLAADNGVIYFPGHWFYPDADRFNAIRLSYSTVPEDRIVEGIRRLGETLRSAPGT